MISANARWRCWTLGLVWSIALAQQGTTPQNQLAVIEGTVVHGLTKEPVRKAHVILEVAQGTHDSALVATTDELGRFRYADVKAGRYGLTVEKSGFLDGSYGADEAEAEASLLEVKDGAELRNLTLLLFPGATITGHVADADGDALPSEQVVLWRCERTNGKVRESRVTETTADQAGQYRFGGLSPGAYYVSASAGAWGYATRRLSVDSSGKVTRVTEYTTFYPAALSLAYAEVINVKIGQEQSGIDIRIQRGPALSVKGRIAGVTGSHSDYSLSATVEDGAGWTSEAGMIQPNGDFVFPALPPGIHTLTLFRQGSNGPQAIGKATVTLMGEDLAGVVITPYKPAQVRVRVVVEGEEDKPLTSGSVFLIPIQGSEDRVDRLNRITSLVQYRPRNGMYVIDDVSPGKYEPWFNNATDCYLKSVQVGDGVLDSELIEVGEGAVIDLLMTFSRNGASLLGDVETALDVPRQHAHVVVISQDLAETSSSKYRWPQMDQSLHFSIAHMRPGKYLAFAIEDEDADLWSNVDFVELMRSKGAAAELREKDAATVHLKLITKAEIDEARKRVGLDR